MWSICIFQVALRPAHSPWKVWLSVSMPNQLSPVRRTVAPVLSTILLPLVWRKPVPVPAAAAGVAEIVTATSAVAADTTIDESAASTAGLRSLPRRRSPRHLELRTTSMGIPSQQGNRPYTPNAGWSGTSLLGSRIGPVNDHAGVRALTCDVR